MLSDASSFLITVVIDFYLTILLLRFMLQWLSADYYNPISQFTIKLTDPVVKPMRKIIPNVAGYDLPSILLLFIIAIVENGLVFWLHYGSAPYILGLILYAVVHLLQLGVNLLFYAIIIRAILSWVNPQNYNPGIAIIALITEPLLAPIRRKLPSVAGIDLSPLLLLIVLQMINLVIISRLLVFAKGLAIVG